MRRVLLVLAFLLLPITARAAEGARVVIAVTGNGPESERWPEAEKRIARELVLMGLEVETQVLDLAGHDLLDALPELASGRGAVAAIHVARKRGGTVTQIAIQDRVTDKVVVRTISAGQGDGSGHVAELALEVVELLNASFLELELRSDRSRRSVPEPVAEIVDRAVARIERRDEHVGLELLAGAGLSISNEDLAPLPGVAVGLDWSALEWLRVGGDLFGTVWPATLENDLGSAKAGTAAARLHVSLEPWPSFPVSPRVGAGVGGLLLWAAGNAKSGHEDRRDTAGAVLGFTRMALSIALAESWSLDVAGACMFSMPHLGVYFGQDAVAGVGRPLSHVEVLVGRAF
jgi:hypothetical protein